MASFNLQSSLRKKPVACGVTHRNIQLTDVAIKISYLLLFSCPLSLFPFVSCSLISYSASSLPSFLLLFLCLSGNFIYLSFTFVSLISYSILFFFISCLLFTFYFLPLPFLSFYPSFSVALFFLSFPYASVFLDNLRLSIVLFNFIFITFLPPTFHYEIYPAD